VFIDLAGELSRRFLGSDFNYARLTFTPRAFFSPFPSPAHLVVAVRGMYSVQSSGVPFFAMNSLAFTDAEQQGLGGLRTLRGYKQDRFVGPVAALANVELRWTAVHFSLWSQFFGLSLAPFYDLGRVFDRVSQFSWSDWKQGAGAGLRVAWNKSTIIVFDFGISREDRGLYMDFGHMF
jgi:hypothetical protein